MAGLPIAVVGYGYWGKNYVRNLVERDTPVVVVDPDSNRRQAASDAFSGIATFQDLASIPQPVAAAVICTPPATHYTLGTEAMRLGASVLVEKPLATSGDECRELIATAEQQGVTLMVGHTYDYNASIDHLAERVAQADLGAVRYIDSSRLSVGGYRDDVNVMWDMAPHDIVAMRRILDAWPNRVSAWAQDHAGTGFADVAQLRLDFDDLGVTGYIRVSWLNSHKVRQLSVVGQRKIAVFDETSVSGMQVQEMQTGGRTGLGERSTHPLPGIYDTDLISTPFVKQNEPLGEQLEHFLDCVAKGRQPRSCGVEGLQVVEILEAADRSADTGMPVQLRTQATMLEAV